MIPPVLRSANPLDLASLLLLQARACPNEARSRHALMVGGHRALPYGALLREWLWRKADRRAWLLARRGMAAGVIVVRRRMGPTAWEVGWFQAARGDGHTFSEMLEAATQATGELGAQKLFLRLRTGSPFEAAVRAAMFCPLVSEDVYVRRAAGEASDAPPASAALRAASEADEFPLYHLYQSVVPAPAREAEGMTAGQWREGLDLPRGWRWEDGLVLEREGAVAGWAAVSEGRRSAMLHCLVGAQGLDGAEALIRAALAKTRASRGVACALAGYQQALARPLEAQGFQKAASQVLYVRHVTVRVREPEIVAAGALSR